MFTEVCRYRWRPESALSDGFDPEVIAVSDQVVVGAHRQISVVTAVGAVAQEAYDSSIHRIA